jgi:hypothetical protein
MFLSDNHLEFAVNKDARKVQQNVKQNAPEWCCRTLPSGKAAGHPLLQAAQDMLRRRHRRRLPPTTLAGPA